MAIIEKCCCIFPLRGGSYTIVILDLLSMISFLTKHPTIFSLVFPFLPIIGLYGIIKRIPKYVQIYVFSCCIKLLIGVLLIILIAIFSRMIITKIPEEDKNVYIVVLLVWLAFHAYFTLVVYSYYQEMKHGSQSSTSAAVV